MPKLENVKIINILATHNGPSLIVTFDLPKFADKPPKKWNKSFDVVRIRLVFDLENLEWNGWDQNATANIDIDQIDRKCCVMIKSADMSISFRSRFIRVDSINGIISGER